ncbi:GT2 family glycosyltransferase [Lachnospiraceae bacterium PF1-21]|uniref:glycosyltransferase family 2 protein n=1 Tax=Ohessyouella blattaphilus TaxID=2949333 RepID=UPI003E267E92
MEVTVVIPNYNGKHFMKDCLDALDMQSFKDFKTIVVDNASTDGSLEYMNTNYPHIPLLSLKKNYGFSRAVNEGIQAADTPYVILLNNDTRPYPGYVNELVKAIKSNKKIFSVSSKMLQMHDPTLIDDAGDLYTLLGWPVARGVGRSSSLYNTTSTVFSACAGAAIYRRSIFDEIGYFDEAHFAYLEDVDVGYRAQIYGYKNMYCPTALVEHVGSGTSGSKYNTFKIKLSARNSIYLNYKNMPLLQLLINLPFLLIGFAIKTLFFIKIGHGKDYINGLGEGLANAYKQKKVPFKFKKTVNYLYIEYQLVKNTVLYTIDWIKRRTTSR